MSQQVWNIQAAEVLAVVGSIHTKAFCGPVSAPCLETPAVAACPTAGAGKLRCAQAETFFCRLPEVAEWLMLLLGVTRGLPLTPQFSLLITAARVTSDLPAQVRQVAEQAGKGDFPRPCSPFPRLRGGLADVELCCPRRYRREHREVLLGAREDLPPHCLPWRGCSYRRGRFGDGVSSRALQLPSPPPFPSGGVVPSRPCAGWDGGRAGMVAGVWALLAGGCRRPSGSDTAAGAPCPNQLGRGDLWRSWCSRSTEQIGGYLFQ